MSCFRNHKYLRTFKMTYSFVEWLIAYNSYLLKSKCMSDTHVWHCNTRFLLFIFLVCQCLNAVTDGDGLMNTSVGVLHTPYYQLGNNNNSCRNNSRWNLFDRQIQIALIPRISAFNADPKKVETNILLHFGFIKGVELDACTLLSMLLKWVAYS